MFAQITAGNVEAFNAAVEGFAARRGRAAGIAWLTKRNPWAQIHIEREHAFTSREYPFRVARAVVRGEYAHGPLPHACPEPGCGGVCWYRATCGSMKCDRCGALDLDGGYDTL